MAKGDGGNMPNAVSGMGFAPQNNFGMRGGGMFGGGMLGGGLQAGQRMSGGPYQRTMGGGFGQQTMQTTPGNLYGSAGPSPSGWQNMLQGAGQIAGIMGGGMRPPDTMGAGDFVQNPSMGGIQPSIGMNPNQNLNYNTMPVPGSAGTIAPSNNVLAQLMRAFQNNGTVRT